MYRADDDHWPIKLRAEPVHGLAFCLLTDLEREIAVGPVGVDRKHMPCHVVCSAAARTQRDRYLVSADSGFAGIDALTAGPGHADRAERHLQLFGEPQRH